MNISREAIEIEMANRCLTVKAVEQLSGVSHKEFYTLRKLGRCQPITAGKIANALGVSVEKIVAKEA